MLVWARYGVQMVAMIAWLGPSMRLDMLRTKRLPLQLVRSIVLLVSSLLFVTALRSPPLAEATALMPWTDAALIIAAGLFGTLGHFLFILAFRHAPASAITPFTYVQLVWATLAGWIFYRHFPDTVAISGMAVIAGSGLLIALHERRRARRRALDPVTVQ